MNKFLAPDPSEFKKLEKEGVIKELEKAIQKGKTLDVEDLKKLRDLTRRNFYDEVIIY
jgi:hypothetical protein